MDAQQLEDGLGRNVLLERRVVEAGVERGAGWALRRLGVVADGSRRGHEFALAVARDGGEMVALGEDRDLDRLHLARVGRRGHQREADLLAGLEILGAEDRRQRLDDVVWPRDGSVPTLVNRLISVSPLPTLSVLVCGAGEQIVVEFVLVLVGGVSAICGSRWCAARAEAGRVFGVIGRLQQCASPSPIDPVVSVAPSA